MDNDQEILDPEVDENVEVIEKLEQLCEKCGEKPITRSGKCQMCWFIGNRFFGER